MASKRVVPAAVLQSWKDVDECLRDIGERERRVDAAKAKAAQQIAAINEKLETAIANDVAMIARQEADIKAYTEAHQDELSGRSKRLTHGVVKLTRIRELKPLDKWTWAKVLERLQELKRNDLIRTKPEVNKEAIVAAKMTPQQMETIGVRHLEKDSFSYELAEAQTASS